MYKRLKAIKSYIADWIHRKWPHAWLGYIYFRIFKKPLNEKEPKTYAERLIVAMQSQEFEKLVPYVDKWAVREYVHNKIGEEYDIPLLAVYESPSRVQYELIPEGAYVKLNHGSGYNIVYHDEQKEQIQNQVESWYHADYSKIYGEVQKYSKKDSGGGGYFVCPGNHMGIFFLLLSWKDRICPDIQ